jgi:hypothetical protein
VQHEPPWEGILITLLRVGVLTVLNILIVVAVGRPLSGSFFKSSQPAKPGSGQPVTPAWVWILAVLDTAGMFWLLQPDPNAPIRRRASSYRLSLVVAGGVGLAFCGALAAIQFYRADEAGVRRAQKRAEEGDLEGAIADLREQIED